MQFDEIFVAKFIVLDKFIYWHCNLRSKYKDKQFLIKK